MSYEFNQSTAAAALPKNGPGDSVSTVGQNHDSFADLPPADTKRWVVRRKEQVVQAVQAGRLTRESACERYHLSDEEYGSWEQQLSTHGVRGLRVTRLQDYRRHPTIDKIVSAPVARNAARNPRMLVRDEA